MGPLHKSMLYNFCKGKTEFLEQNKQRKILLYRIK